MSTHWFYGTAVHRNSSSGEHEEYLSVHEIYYEEEEAAKWWTTGSASPGSKEDALRIAEAFDRPPVLWVDDASYTLSDGFHDYGRWGWIAEKEDDDVPR